MVLFKKFSLIYKCTLFLCKYCGFILRTIQNYLYEFFKYERSPGLWKGQSEKVLIAYTYYANLHGPEAKTIGMSIGFGLKNAYNVKSGKSY